MAMTYDELIQSINDQAAAKYGGGLAEADGGIRDSYKVEGVPYALSLNKDENGVTPYFYNKDAPQNQPGYDTQGGIPGRFNSTVTRNADGSINTSGGYFSKKSTGVDAVMDAAPMIGAAILFGTALAAAGGGAAAGAGAAESAGDIIAKGIAESQAAGGWEAYAASAMDSADVVGSIIGETAASGSLTPELIQQASALAEVPAGSLTPELLQQAGFTAPQIEAAGKAGWSLSDIVSAVKTGGSALGGLSSILGLAGNALGSKYAANTAGIASGQQAAAAQNAANILSPAATQAAGVQANAATQSANTLADAYKSAGSVQAGAATQAGQQLSMADQQAANMLAGGYTAAAGQQVAGMNQAIGTAGNVLAQQTALQQPYIGAGTQALDTLSKGLLPGGQFNRGFTMADAQNMPAYQFALEQGKQAIDASAARGGTQLSSNNINSLTTFAEGTAAQYQQQAFNQWLAQNNLTLGGLQNMVHTGQVSASQLQNALQQYGVSAETIQQNIGAAQGAGTLGAAKAVSTGITNSAQDLAKQNSLAAGFTGQGILGAGQSLAAGQVGSAGYTAGGITGAANANAAGVIGVGNATASSTTSQGNIMGAGLSNIGNQLFTMGAAPNKSDKPNTPNQPQTPVNSNIGTPISMGSQPMVGGAAIDPSLPTPAPIPVAPSFTPMYDPSGSFDNYA
jgi:hypothetical protein